FSFHTSGEFLVKDGVADSAADLVFVLAFAAGFQLGVEVDAPVPARRELVAEEQPAVDLVRRTLKRGILEVDRWIAPDLPPVGQRPAKLDLCTVVIVTFLDIGAVIE